MPIRTNNGPDKPRTVSTTTSPNIIAAPPHCPETNVLTECGRGTRNELSTTACALSLGLSTMGSSSTTRAHDASSGIANPEPIGPNPLPPPAPGPPPARPDEAPIVAPIVAPDDGPDVGSLGSGPVSGSSTVSASSTRYSRDRAMSSSCVPESRTLPFPMTTTRSANESVERRWATNNTVRSAITDRSASCTDCSVRVSSADVASSSTRTRGSVMSARARASRWRCPPDSVRPCSPTTVSYPLGSSMMNSCAWAAPAAATMSSKDASGLAKLRLSFTDDENKKASSNTIDTAALSDASVRSFTSWPSITTEPLFKSMNRASVIATVDLPDPLAPINATRSPGASASVTPSRALCPPGYVTTASVITTWPTCCRSLLAPIGVALVASKMAGS